MLVVFAIFDISFGRSIIGSVSNTRLEPSQVRKACPGRVLPGANGKIEKGPEDRPFRYLFLLPVGLADFMGWDATVENRGRQRVLLRNVAEKNRAFSRARPVNREEVTIDPA
ncbi:MAG: hypothetical protein ACK47C_10875 [Paracoccaceae bacterium]|jgi:hypothetical protein